MERGPPIRVNNVELSLAPKDLLEGALLLERVHAREHNLVNGRLANDRSLGIDILAAVDQVLQIL